VADLSVIAYGRARRSSIMAPQNFYGLPTDRATTWRPGVTHNGGFPHGAWPQRSVLTWASGDQTSRIQSEIDAAHTANPSGVIVNLGAGTWNLNGGDVTLPSNTVIRGAALSSGAWPTILTCTNGAIDNSYLTGARGYQPLITIGGSASLGTSKNLTADATKGTNSCTVGSASGLSVGQYVLIDEYSGAFMQTDPQGMGQVLASAGFEVVWQLHNPGLGTTDDPLIATTPVSGDAASWFCRQDRPQSEIKRISNISGTMITFDSPFHKTYYSSRTAQLTPYSNTVTNSGVENLACSYGSNGNIRIEGGAYCWVTNVDASHWLNENICINNSFRCELSGSYLHDGAWPVPGGGGYAISLGFSSSEHLIEDNIIRWTCKNMVARCAGAGSVIAYNYADEAFDQGFESWMEVHLNASHMVGPFMVLFEGNYAPNADSDKTHGNSTRHVFFRNHLSGYRRSFTTPEGSHNDIASDPGAHRCAGMSAFSRYMSWVGNVLGLPGEMSGFVYEDTTNAMMVSGVSCIYTFGWDDWYSSYPTIDPDVDLLATTLRDGNFDYLTNQVHWHGVGGSGSSSGLTPPAVSTLPNSFYLSSKPSFFGSYTWPWVDAQGSTKTYTLPAKARYDAGTPFV